MDCARLLKLVNVLPLRDTRAADAILDIGQCAKAIVLQLKDPVGIAKRLAEARQAHGFDFRENH